MFGKNAAFRVFLTILAFTALFSLSGCRKVFDHAGYVKALLDAAYKAEFAEYIVLTGSTEEDARKQYEENLEYFVDEICLSLEVNISQERRDKIRAVMEEMLSATDYEVLGAEKVDQNRYEVEIKIKPVTNFKQLEHPISQFAEEFIANLQSAEMMDTTPEELNELYIDGLIGVIEEGVRPITYGAEKTIKTPVDYYADRKRWYILPEEQGKIFDALIELK